MNNIYDQLWNDAKIQALEAKHSRCTGELEMKMAENAFTIEQRYYDLNAKLDALCKHLDIKIDKQSGYTVRKE